MYEDWTPEEVAKKDELILAGHLPHAFRTDKASEPISVDADAVAALMVVVGMLPMVDRDFYPEAQAILSSIALTSVEEAEKTGGENVTDVAGVRADDIAALSFYAAKAAGLFGPALGAEVLRSLEVIQPVFAIWQEGKIAELKAGGMTDEELAANQAQALAYFDAEFR